jgi:penicillin-binding protein 1C
MKKIFFIFSFILILLTIILIWKTSTDLRSPPNSLSITNSNIKKVQVLDRYATPLTITYQNDWNIHYYVPLHDIPEILQKFFILAEDKRFFEHGGSDWIARWHAMWQNIKALRVVRGASTISEQTVRILYPRPRTFWSHWLEGIEASRLEKRVSKADILEFYLNQVPYASQRRGVLQAARYYFDRDLDTLSLKEMMALAVLIRAPSRLDLHKGIVKIEAPIARLAKLALNANVITEVDYDAIVKTPLQIRDSHLPIEAAHFVNYVSQTNHALEKTSERLHTTLDGNIQQKVQTILDQRVQDLKHKNVNNGAVLVVDNKTREILAWVNAGKFSSNQIDAVTTPRQPGSTLKPFLYALALKNSWTAASLIDDSPLAQAVGTGLHSFRNYSRHHYGPIRMRDALGNSLNIPAIRAIQFLGVAKFLQTLHGLGFTSLTAHYDYYGEGLALGNGAVTLFELVQAYTSLANQGNFSALKVLANTRNSNTRNIFSPEITSIIADILSDSDARRLEFGLSALLRLPVQTAVKTGTSNDYRDAWAVGFNSNYTVGIWLGNLDQQPMLQVSGSSGSALILRAVFNELNRYNKTRALYLSPKLVQMQICRKTGQIATGNCPSRMEWFIPGTEPAAVIENKSIKKIYLTQPSPGLQIAMDPRIPDENEAFALRLSNTDLKATKIEWIIDGKVIGTTSAKQKKFLWNLQLGTHTAQAKIWSDSDAPLTTASVRFYVK